MILLIWTTQSYYVRKHHAKGNLFVSFITHTHLNRYRQIAEVLVHHGLGYMVSTIGLERFVPFRKEISRFARSDAQYTRPERVRKALEELGPTFIKLGQILSTREDILPPDYIAELAKLQDQAPPVESSVIEEIIARELGCSLEDAFATFDPVPVAAASIGQAHAATLPNGDEVIVKVRRPGVVAQIEEDLEILQNLAATASRRWEFAEHYDVPGLVQEFAHTLRDELDYIREGRNAERFAVNCASTPFIIHIPSIYWETTTDSILTMERIRGIKINDLAALDASGIDRPALAERAVHIILKMILEDGFYHADPHPGNFFIEPDGRIGLIDYGLVGVVDAQTREQLVDIFLAITSQDVERLVDTLLMLGISKQPVDRPQLKRDLERLLSRYYGKSFGEIDIGPVLTEALKIVQQHHLQLPSNLALLLKTLLMDEALGTMLDPSFNMTAMLESYSKQLLQRQYSLDYWWRNVSRAGMETARLGIELPQHIRRLINDLEHGNLQVGVNPETLKPIIDEVKPMVNRVVLGIIAASFIVGVAILLTVYQRVIGLWWVGALFIIGFVLSFVLGIYLAITSISSRKKQ
jgi:ubiquinone biosynthesis protein